MGSRRLRKLLKRWAQTPVDKGIVISIGLLVTLGILVLYAASFYNAIDKPGGALSDVRHQLIGVGLGLVAMLVLSRVDYHFYFSRWFLLTALGVSLVLLALVPIPGIGRMVNGSRRWIYVGPISVQPSEIAKFAMVLFMAASLTNRDRRVGQFFTGILPLLLVPGVMFILILAQPNLSTAGSILIVAVLLVMIAGARWRHLAMLGVMGTALGAFYAWVEPYRRARLLSFTDPFAKLSNEGYQLAQSLLAFGSGGLFGMGLGVGRQKYAFLPYPESDFIFAVVGEDMGLFGCLLVIALFMLFIWRGLRVAARCPDRFGSLLAAGITTMIGIQCMLNIAVVIGLAPTTGLPLPFFSAGGTSVSILMAMVGVLLNISRET